MRLLAAVGAGVMCCVSGALAQLSEGGLDSLRARAKAEGWTFTVDRTPATQYPIEQLCGLIVPQDWRENARFAYFAEKADLPASFSWRSLGGCPPIRDQGNCGSCWAFGTAGPLECNILIKDGLSVNLSEQWLVSCNQETEPPHVLLGGTWGCDGGWWAHDYHCGVKTDPCGDSGAVLEADCPYTQTEAACGCPYPHTYAFDDWAYIGPEEGVADTDAIKQAILDYGPVSAAVYVNSAFASYSGGIFNAHEDEEPNHAVVLVGWDDEQGANGVWILRNSWSNIWGEYGYMRIEYGCSNVGFGACYVDYAGAGNGIGPAITRQPAGGGVPPGWRYRLSVEGEGIGELHYQWQHDGEDVGGDEPFLWLDHVAEEDAGSYVCLVSDVRGTTASALAEIVLDPAIRAPAQSKVCALALAVLLGWTGALGAKRRGLVQEGPRPEAAT